MEKSTLGIFSERNLFSNCYKAQDGGVYFIKNSILSDSSSSYKSIQALYGGVMKCNGCNFTISGGNMDYNQALSGGIFMVENSATGLIQSTSFVGTKAKLYGGLMSVTQSGLTAPSPSTITFLNCQNIKNVRADMGGIFYLN